MPPRPPGSSCCPSRPSPSPISSTTWRPSTSEWARVGRGRGWRPAPRDGRNRDNFSDGAEPPLQSRGHRPPGLPARPGAGRGGAPRVAAAAILTSAGILAIPRNFGPGARRPLGASTMPGTRVTEVNKAMPRPPWGSGTGVGAGRHAQLSYERGMLARVVVLCSFGFAGTLPCMDTHILTIS